MVERPSQQTVRAPLEREMIRVGVIGTRFGARVHVPALRKLSDVRVVAMCGSDIQRTRQSAGELGVAATYDNYRDLLTSGEIDAVTIAAPPHLHHNMVLSACEQGIHILCEKPMARNAAEARDMVRMARETGVAHGVAYMRRYEPVRQQVKQLVQSGFIGDLHSVSVIAYRSTLADQQSRQFSWLMEREKGGGVAATIGSHFVDTLRWWFGEIHGVCGAVSTAIESRPAASGEMRLVDADDNTAFVLRFASGAIGSVSISYTAATDVGEEIVISGSEGMLAVQEPGRLVGTQRGGKIQDMMPAPPPPPAGETRTVQLYGQLVAGWVAALRSGQDVLPSFEDGAKVQEVVDAVSRSMQLSRWIDLSGNKWPV
jgi:predicted dehydrogenase